jgi:hypothetical protein
MGFISGSTGTSTSTSSTAPWKDQAPYIRRGFKDALDIYKNFDPKYYTGNPVAGFTGDQKNAFKLTRNYVRNGDPNLTAASGYNQDVLSGKYLNNPYSDSVYDNIKSHVMPSVNSQFSNSGRYGSALHADTATRGLTEAYAPYAAQQHQQGLDRMGQAAAFAPTLANEKWKGINALSSVGMQRQALAQKEKDDAMARWNYYQDLPYQKLNQYMSTIGGNFGSTSTSAQPYHKPSTLSQILGGLAAGAGILG